MSNANRKELAEYEKMMDDMLIFAIAGLFIVPTICAALAFTSLKKVEKEFEIPICDMWKKRLVCWQFAFAIIRLVLTAIFFIISTNTFLTTIK